MDSWFIELFDIISRQRETLKVEMLLKELYGEFDILVRRHSIQELKEIYYYAEEKNQINTVNIETTIDNKNDVIFLVKANFFPKITDSAGSCIIPTVTHATKKEVTAINPMPCVNNSPPKI